MHAVAEIIIPPTKDIKASITTVMEYFIEEDDKGEKPKGGHADWWDFWEIGGRFSGRKIECKIDPNKLTQFNEFLKDQNITVSPVTCGKHGIERVDICTVATIPDELTCDRLIIAGLEPNFEEWSRNFDLAKAEFGVGVTEESFFHQHPRWNEARRKADDVTPKTELCVQRMWLLSYWNTVEWQPTAFEGNVKKALADMRTQPRLSDEYPWCGWEDDYLVVTVDYHN